MSDENRLENIEKQLVRLIKIQKWLLGLSAISWMLLIFFAIGMNEASFEILRTITNHIKYMKMIN